MSSVQFSLKDTQSLLNQRNYFVLEDPLVTASKHLDIPINVLKGSLTLVGNQNTGYVVYRDVGDAVHNQNSLLRRNGKGMYHGEVVAQHACKVY